MRVRELKALLDAAGISYAGVNERSELVALLVDHQLSSPDAVGIDTTPLVRRLSLRDADVPALEELVLFPSVLNPAVMFAPGEAISNEFESIVSRASALHGEPGPDEPGVVVGFDSEGRISLQFVNQRPEDADTVEDALSLLRRIHSLQRRVAELTGQGMTALTELSQTHNLAALSVPPPLSLSDTRRVRFCEAVAAGEIAAVESLLVDDALELVSFFNTSGLYGVMDHPLTSAVMKGHLPLLSTLLAAGFMDGNHVFPSGQSALHAACSSGCTDPSILLHLLQNSGLDLLNLPSSLDGSTPLWAATVSNDSFAVSALTSAGAAVDAIASKTNTTPLWEACARDFAKVARTLLAAGADLNFKRETDSVNPLWIACANGSTQCVSLLLKQATPAQQQEATASALSPMAVACALGHTHIVDLLASSSGEPPWASIHGHLHLVKLFLP